MRSALVALPLLILALGCEPQGHPGVSIGTFQITGSLDQNGCGAAVPALDPISFSVELRDDLGRGVWVQDEGPIQTGIRMPDGAYRFRYGATVPVIAPQPGYRGCNLQQVEFIEVRIEPYESDGEEEPPIRTPIGGEDADGGVVVENDIDLALEGLSEIQYTPTSTSDCSPLPVVNGGPWAALPCTLTYTLFGSGLGPDPARIDEM